MKTAPASVVGLSNFYCQNASSVKIYIISKLLNGKIVHLTPSDPDIATLYRRISQERLDLQPNFQRGEVWGRGKKQRLIDSILRGWHIPPVHVIQVPSSDKQEVLDGQQRLAAIRDFIDNQFPINGEQAPVDIDIAKLDGLYWNDLEQTIRSRIEDFTIRLLTISDYKPGEPGELFYRLNQPTNLTSAEQRNAYFGEARQQVKDLASYMLDLGFSSELIGFSNSRMAYDDVLAKFLLTLEIDTLTEKHTANSVTARYRESTGFSKILEKSARNSLKDLYNFLNRRETETKLNKATIFTWLIFIHSARKRLKTRSSLPQFFDLFESFREDPLTALKSKMFPKGVSRSALISVVNIYQDRASSRVSDVSSVVLRDFILWGMFAVMYPDEASSDSTLQAANENFIDILFASNTQSVEYLLSTSAIELKWGANLC